MIDFKKLINFFIFWKNKKKLETNLISNNNKNSYFIENKINKNLLKFKTKESNFKELKYIEIEIKENILLLIETQNRYKLLNKFNEMNKLEALIIQSKNSLKIVNRLKEKLNEEYFHNTLHLVKSHNDKISKLFMFN